MTPIAPRVLVIDGEESARRSLRQELERAACSVEEAPSVSAGLEAASRDAPDVVLLDGRAAERSAAEALREFARSHPLLPVVVLSARDGRHAAAVEAGAYEHLVEPFEPSAAVNVVRRAAEWSLLREQLARARDRDYRESGLRTVVAESRAMGEVVREIERIAASQSSAVLLLGERGVGLRTVARALHAESSARDLPFHRVACAAMPEPELEIELFGRERSVGAPRRGLLELAGGGTVYLDEVGGLSLALQSKLMRCLERGDFRRVDGARDRRHAARILASTRADLRELVRLERFRRDLYELLRATTLEVPPLRRRPEDVPLLARGFLERFGREFGKSFAGFAADVEGRLVAYEWPGNVRELRNAIERAALLAVGPTITFADLSAAMARKALASSTGAAPQAGAADFVLPEQGLVFSELERHLLCQALERSRGNRTHAARLLGLNRDRIRYRIQKFGLEKFALGPHS